jgi:hypothetical protein
MTGTKGFLQMFLGDVGVALCGGDARVAEELLDDTDVRATAEEQSGDRVPEHMRRNARLDLGRRRQSREVVGDSLARFLGSAN